MNRIPIKWLIIVSLAALGLVVSGSLWQQKAASRHGTVTIIIGAPDTIGVEAKLDGNSLTLDGLQTKKVLPDGNHSLIITKPGYTDFATSFTVNTNDTLQINAYLPPKTVPKLRSFASITPATLAASWQIGDVKYFGNQDWAFINARYISGAPAIFIVHYDDSAHAWKVIEGPETIIAASSTKKLPVDLVKYLQDNNYLLGGQ